MKEVVHCWKVDVDNIDDDDPQGIQIKESEGEHVLKGKVLEMVALDYNGPIKTKKHNIDTEEVPKIPSLEIIGIRRWSLKLSTYSRNMRTCFPRDFQK
jgi:hypothetical protein